MAELTEREIAAFLVGISLHEKDTAYFLFDRIKDIEGLELSPDLMQEITVQLRAKVRKVKEIDQHREMPSLEDKKFCVSPHSAFLFKNLPDDAIHVPPDVKNHESALCQMPEFCTCQCRDCVFAKAEAAKADEMPEPGSIDFKDLKDKIISGELRGVAHWPEELEDEED